MPKPRELLEIIGIKLLLTTVILVIIISDILDQDSKIIVGFRKKLEKGIVKDEDLAEIENYVENVLERKVEDFLESKHYKGFFKLFTTLF